MTAVTSAAVPPRSSTGPGSRCVRRAGRMFAAKRRRDITLGLLGVIGFGVFASDPVFNGADLAMFASFGLMSWGVIR